MALGRYLLIEYLDPQRNLSGWPHIVSTVVVSYSSNIPQLIRSIHRRVDKIVKTSKSNNPVLNRFSRVLVDFQTAAAPV